VLTIPNALALRCVYNPVNCPAVICLPRMAVLSSFGSYFEGYGTFHGKINGHRITLHHVLFSKNVSKNIISGIKLSKEGIYTLIASDRKNKPYISLIMNNRVIGTFYSNIHNIIHMTINPINTNSHNLLNIEIDNNNLKIWHNRLGHFFLYDINKYLKLNKIKPLNCTECRISKMNKDLFNGTPPRATEILECKEFYQKQITNNKF